MKKSKKFISLLLSFVILLGITAVFGISTYADDEDVVVTTYTSGDFEYQLLDNGTAEITAYNGSDTELVIPSEIDDYVVTSIGYCAFYKNSNLRNVSMGDCITNIGSWSFAYCGSLSQIKLSDQITNIDEYAFYQCIKLQNIKFPNKLVSIGKWSFADCTSLAGTLDFPDSLETIGYNAFYCCENIEKITIGKKLKTINSSFPHGMMVNYKLENVFVSEHNPYFSSKDGVLFNKYISELILYPDSKKGETYCVPKTVEIISKDAFINTHYLTSIVITDNVKNIEENAFFLTYLNNVVILNKDCIIDENYFYGERENKTIYYGYKDSAVQKYASKLGCQFVQLEDNQIIFDGTDGEYIIGSENGFSIHCENSLSDFVSVSVNGEIIDKLNYTLEEGSTILTFKSEYLDTLKAGDYYVTLTYTNAIIPTILTINEGGIEKPNVRPSEPSTEQPDKTPTEQPTVPVEKPTKPADENPTAVPTQPSNDAEELTTNKTIDDTSNTEFNNTTEAATGNQSSPDTGNNINLTPMILLAVSSALVLVLSVSKRKKVTE